MTASKIKLVHPARIADGRAGVRHVFVHGLVLSCIIGIHDHEREVPQRVRINIDMAVQEGDEKLSDNIASVVCYDKITSGIRDIVNTSKVKLVETLAEKISAMCLRDDRVRSVRVRVEKLDIFEDATSAGVEIERFNPEV